MLTHRQSLTALAIGILLLLFGTGVLAAQVNINTADAATLARELKGIGLKRAQDIVEYRQKHGPFRSIDELALVKGIGPAAIAKNRELIRTDTKGAAPAANAPSKSSASAPAKAVTQPSGSSSRGR
jgi:competence protein ComEA